MKTLKTYERKLNNNFYKNTYARGENALDFDKFDTQITALNDLIEGATLTITDDDVDTTIHYQKDVSIGQFLIDYGILKNISKKDLRIGRYVKRYGNSNLYLQNTKNVVDFIMHNAAIRRQNYIDARIKKANVLIDNINKDKSDAEFYLESSESSMILHFDSSDFSESMWTKKDSYETTRMLKKDFQYRNPNATKFELTLCLKIPVTSIKLGIKNIFKSYEKCFKNMDLLDLCELHSKTDFDKNKATYVTKYTPKFNNHHVGISSHGTYSWREISFKLFVKRALIKSEYYYNTHISEIQAAEEAAAQKVREQKQKELALKTVTDNFNGCIEMYNEIKITSITAFTEAGFDEAGGFSTLTCASVTNKLGNKILLSISQAKCGIIEVLGYVNPNTNNCVSQDVVKRMFNQTSVIM